MNPLHSGSSPSSLFARLHRKTRRIADVAGLPTTCACRRLMDSLESAWSAVRAGTSHTHRR
ncbi:MULTISPECIES: hypothetical protein [unclassified Burkholderia]|uniref:hypothetical protein n=1 Tax=unclassified Burkholderia TaxID=2613784 RepID=UPI002AB04F94|nr:MULTISPECIES: hypothetical protein [unclassified Burkholderia]